MNNTQGTLYNEAALLLWFAESAAKEEMSAAAVLLFFFVSHSSPSSHALRHYYYHQEAEEEEVSQHQSEGARVRVRGGGEKGERKQKRSDEGASRERDDYPRV